MEPPEIDVDRHEAYWDGFTDGQRHGETEAKLKLSQSLSAIKRLNTLRDIHEFCDRTLTGL